jgi:osmotically-inducible protein OsmY
VADVFGGRRRTPIESRVLDNLWSDRVLGRRRIDVAEVGPGRVVLTGRVRSREEVGRAVAVAERAKGVTAVVQELQVAR